MELRFQYPEYFWLFTAIPFFILLFLLLLRWKKRTIKRMGDEHLVKQLIKNYSPRLFAFKFILIILSFSMGVLALANLRRPRDEDIINLKGIDVVIALDVSKSMLATDISPNRLERAKKLALKLIEKMPNDRFALVVFAGRAYMQMPLTTDHGTAALYISTTSPAAVPTQGTVLSEALQTSADIFNTKEGRFKTIILISDGEDHDENASKTADKLAAQGIMLCTVGIGSAEGSRIPDPATGDFKKDAAGNIVVSKLNEGLLKEIAEKTNGIYIHFEDTEQVLKPLLQQLSQIEKKAFSDKSLLNYTTYYMWFVGAMLLLLIAESLIPERKKMQDK